MKKILSLLAVFLLSVMFVPAGAEDLSDERSIGSSAERMPMEENMISGSLVSLDAERQEITVRAQAPGILGAGERDFAYTLDEDSVMTICVETLNSCDTLTGPAALYLLESIENTGISDYRDYVDITMDPLTDKVVHVKVSYNRFEEG